MKLKFITLIVLIVLSFLSVQAAYYTSPQIQATLLSQDPDPVEPGQVVKVKFKIENLGKDYVRTAFAKGLKERTVIFKHALRNSLIPLATGLGHIFSLVLAGSFLISLNF